jgi:hypothetical protein
MQNTNKIAQEERAHSPVQEQPDFNKTDNYEEGFDFEEEGSTKNEFH